MEDFKFGRYNRTQTLAVLESLLSCSLNQQTETITQLTQQLLQILRQTTPTLANGLTEQAIKLYEIAHQQRKEQAKVD